MNTPIVVSVIIPTYGNPIFLSKTIESVILQSFKNWELIIVDDNNPDTEARHKTEQLVEQYISQDNRIKYIKHKCNRNGSVARNTGFAASKGKYISFLDSDDEYMPTRLEMCVAAMNEASEHIAGVYTGCVFKRGGKTVGIRKKVKSGKFLVETLACNFKFSTGSNLFVRHSVYEELNGFDENFLRHQDYEFLVRVFEKYELLAIQEPLVVKNDEHFNMPSIWKTIEIKKQYLSKFEEDINNLTVEERRYINHSHYIDVAEMALRKKEKAISKEFYQKAGRLTIREFLRKTVFRALNTIK